MLDIAKRFAEIRKVYADDESSKYRSFLLYGDSGTGKTHAFSTCPKPVLVFSFDPGGTDTLQALGRIERGEILPILCEDEDRKRPTSFNKFEQIYKQLKAEKVFDKVGTVGIDSLTTLYDNMMDEFLKRGARADTVPRLQDYLKVQLAVCSLLVEIIKLPCHTVVTGHIDRVRDETTGSMKTSLLITGKKTPVKIPLLFSEVYVTQTEIDAKGNTDYSFLTRNDGKYTARTRMGTGIFDLAEKPDIKYLLEKAGLDGSDKELHLQ